MAELELSAEVQAKIEPLVRVMQSVNKQLAALEQQTKTMAQADEVVERLRTAPGVGPLDEVERFESAPQDHPWSWTRAAGRGRVGDRQGEPPRKAAGAANTVTVPPTICTREENSMPMHKPHLAFHRLDLDQGWATPECYPSGIKQKIMAGDIDERHKMGSRSRRRRFEPGAYTTAPFVHDHWKEIYLR